MSTSQDFKTIFNFNLTCIFLSLTAKLKKKHVALGHPVVHFTIGTIAIVPAIIDILKKNVVKRNLKEKLYYIPASLDCPRTSE